MTDSERDRAIGAVGQLPSPLFVITAYYIAFTQFIVFWNKYTRRKFS